MPPPVPLHIAERIRSIAAKLRAPDRQVRPVSFKPVDRLTEILVAELIEHDHEARVRAWLDQLTLMLMQMPWADDAHRPGGEMWQAVCAERIRDALAAAAGSLGATDDDVPAAPNPGLIVAP